MKLLCNWGSVDAVIRKKRSTETLRDVQDVISNPTAVKNARLKIGK